MLGNIAEEIISQQEILESQAQKIQNPVQNLMQKIERLDSSISNLLSKKATLEFEIQRQKKALYFKRQELKKVQKSLKIKAKASLESKLPDGSQEEADIDLKQAQALLQESARILELE